MATLVLTVLGQYLGGPIGGAIGATIGQQIDRDILFAPAGRQGPRLNDLAAQSSSYGSKIPKLFGTCRVAGSVVWATNLKESSSTSGGKGKPKVTSYSYSASFAVLLSARRIKAWGGSGPMAICYAARRGIGRSQQVSGSIWGAKISPLIR